MGDMDWMRRGIQCVKTTPQVVSIHTLGQADARADLIPVLHATEVELRSVLPGTVTAASGRAAYDFLSAAIRLVLAEEAAGIVTAPLHKEGLHLAGLDYPGHTEILAEKTGAREYGMMLYYRGANVPHGLGVVHVTLHCALREVFGKLTTPAILEKIRLLQAVLQELLERSPRLAVAGLNPHASDGGLFGKEERDLIEPAVRQARAEGVDVTGPLPADTLFVRARDGRFDGVVAMYHDQGHIALKLLGGLHAVNVTLGLPLVRTSVAHGTAYDIAGKGIADSTSLIEAARLAALLCRKKTKTERSR
jgi:4-hydroxythreonine-4-phosphate dehydrogenase